MTTSQNDPLQTLATKINNFDYGFRYSDDHRRFDKYFDLEREIEKELSTLSKKEMKALAALITVNPNAVKMSFAPLAKAIKQHAINQLRSEVMRRAHAIHRELGLSWSTALKESWAIAKGVNTSMAIAA